MKKILALFAILTAPIFGQAPLVNERVRTAVDSLNRQVLASSPQVRAAVAAIPIITTFAGQPTIPPAPQAAPIPVATKDQRNQLLSLITSFGDRVSASQRRYSTAATTLIFAGCVLALVASVLSFLKKNTAAGIIGLVVAALAALPTAYPTNNLASFYRTLGAQSTALLYDCTLSDPMPMDKFNSASSQLQLLVLYEGEKYPQLGNTKDASGDLAAELQTLAAANQSGSPAHP